MRYLLAEVFDLWRYFIGSALPTQRDAWFCVPRLVGRLGDYWIGVVSTRRSTKSAYAKRDTRDARRDYQTSRLLQSPDRRLHCKPAYRGIDL